MSIQLPKKYLEALLRCGVCPLNGDTIVLEDGSGRRLEIKIGEGEIRCGPPITNHDPDQPVNVEMNYTYDRASDSADEGRNASSDDNVPG